MLAVLPRAKHLNHAEAGADGQGASKKLLHLFGNRIGGNVVILGNQAEQLIAHAAAGPERLKAGVLQRSHDRDGEFAFGHVFS